MLSVVFRFARHYREPLLVGLGYVAAYAKSAHIDPAMAGVITLAIGGLTAWVKGWKPERLQRTPAAPHCPDKVERPPLTDAEPEIPVSQLTAEQWAQIEADGKAFFAALDCHGKQTQFHAPPKDTHDSRDYQNFTNGETWTADPSLNLTGYRKPYVEVLYSVPFTLADLTAAAMAEAHKELNPPKKRRKKRK